MTNQALFSFIAACPTPYQAIAHTAKQLQDAGFLPLCENTAWSLTPGQGYYVTRNGSSLIAFRVPEKWEGFLITASHCDSPCFKIKENAELRGSAYVQLSTEKYGGMLLSTWLDRPLSIAGRVMVRTASGLRMQAVDLGAPTAIIPNLAIHMNRKANEGVAINPAVDMLPLICTSGDSWNFRSRIAECANISEEDILSTDLFLYNPQPGAAWEDLIAAPRLDDLQCAFGALQGFLQAESAESAQVYCLFDNEEVGSRTKQGAASTFLSDTLHRIAQAYQADYRSSIASSFMVSCDNAHAVHPNHPEFADKNHAPVLNGGVVIKFNANQSYTSDAVSTAIFRLICERASVPFQFYANRADLPGGSTLGNIANTQVSLNTVDIGLAQLAMHSAFETAGAKDTAHLIAALKTFYESPLRMAADGSYQLL